MHTTSLIVLAVAGATLTGANIAFNNDVKALSQAVASSSLANIVTQISDGESFRN